jgi:Lipocalin-like domain
MKKQSCFWGYLLLLLFSASCSKSNSPSKTALLTTSMWRLVAFDIDPARNINGHDETDMFQFYDPCERDDYIIFNADGTFEVNNGPQKCAPVDPQKIIGTWFLSGNDTKLVISPANIYLPDNSDIIELSATAFTIVYYTRASNGTITRIHTLKFIH